MSGQPAIRVLVVDDHAVVRRGVIAYLEAHEGLSVVGEAGSGEGALEALAGLASDALPDVVLLDLQMPGMDGIQTTRQILAAYPSIRVVVLTSFGEVDRARQALQSGVSGYLLKDAGPDKVRAAIESAVRDEVHIDPAVARQLAQELRRPEQGIGSLTVREREVLALLGEGRSNSDIAAVLHISERTARTHVSNLLPKLGVDSRTQAALIAIKEGLVPG